MAIGRAHLPLLPAHFIADAFLRGNNLQVFLVILGADVRRPFEHHVLEQVRDTGDAQPFVGAPDVRDPAARNAWLIMTLHQQEPHPVREMLLDYRNLLGGQRQCPEAE